MAAHAARGVGVRCSSCGTSRIWMLVAMASAPCACDLHAEPVRMIMASQGNPVVSLSASDAGCILRANCSPAGRVIQSNREAP
jgi:hypothetical protein